MTNAGPPPVPQHGLDLAPFNGVRYVPDRIGSPAGLAAVTSPPYDVVVRPDGLHHLESADPHNIVRLILPQPAASGTGTGRAAETLARWQEEGVLTADDSPALYVYEQRGTGWLQRGVIGALRLTEPAEGIVLPHEDVMDAVVAERADLMRATAANLEPLLLSYEGSADSCGTAAVVDGTAARPPLLRTTTEDGIRHTLWALTDEAEISRVREDLRRHQALIADGHHRWATYLRLRDERTTPGPWDRGLVLLVDTSRYPLQVRGIHRVLHGLPAEKALAALQGSFRVTPVDDDLTVAQDRLGQAKQAGGPAFLLAGGGSYHLLDRPDPALIDRTVPSERPALWRELDATVLHSTLLDHLWEVPDDPSHISYVHDAQAAVAKTELGDSTAVLLHPVAEDVVRKLARQGVTMPRKSTSFGPKPATGLVLRTLGD